jgi:hypothetical protein
MITGTPYHLGVVVTDLQRTMSRYASLLGLEHWAVQESADVETVYRGQPQRCVQHFAYAPWGDAYLELVEPVSGDSPATAFLRAHGEGAYHVGYFSEDLSGAALPDNPIDWKVWVDGDLRAIYVDTLTDLGLYVELVATSREEGFMQWVRAATARPRDPA